MYVPRLRIRPPAVDSPSALPVDGPPMSTSSASADSSTLAGASGSSSASASDADIS